MSIVTALKDKITRTTRLPAMTEQQVEGMTALQNFIRNSKDDFKQITDIAQQLSEIYQGDHPGSNQNPGCKAKEDIKRGVDSAKRIAAYKRNGDAYATRSILDIRALSGQLESMAGRLENDYGGKTFTYNEDAFSGRDLAPNVRYLATELRTLLGSAPVKAYLAVVTQDSKAQKGFDCEKGQCR